MLALSRPFIALVALATCVTAQSGLYGQCGGKGWSGATTCSQGVCTYVNDYYSQCLPGSSTASSTSTTSSTSSTSTSTTTKTSSSSTSTTATSTTSGSSSTSTPIDAKWQAAYAKAKTALAKLSLSDKVSLTTGTGWQKGPCVGNTPPISSINYPQLCLQDSPVGVRYADKVSAFPAQINAAATFNRTLMNLRGSALGAEFKGKGVHVALGPMMNLMRAPAAGRNWEGFGGDPYLSGEGAYQTVLGIQSAGVQASAKHYINNEQEHYRTEETSQVDDRTQHELYFHPFLKSVQAGVASVMCSYNQINGTYACENSNMLNGMLKTEAGFAGYVMSDWSATMSGVPSVLGGLDMTMPGDITFNSGTTYFGQNLVNAVNQGQVSQARVDDMATRILAAWYLTGQDSGFPATNFNSWSSGSGSHVDVTGNHASLIRDIGSASTVLLKNTNGALPLNKPKSIALIGSAAATNPSGPNACSDRGCNTGTLAVGWGSGANDFPYLTSPVTAITAQAKNDGTSVTSSTSDTDTNAAANAASGKDVAIVFITADSGEGYITVEGANGDRNDLEAWHSGAALVSKVASVNKNTIVVVQSVGPINLETFADLSGVTAIVWSGLAGQEAGNSLVDILYGFVNPSGRLPYTIGKKISDYPAQVLYSSGSQHPVINYSEGLLIDYRWFDAKNIAPRYAFGFGLSYTTFDYSKASVSGSVGSYTPPSGPGSSVNANLHTTVFTVSFTLTNNGTLAGHEVPQLYLSPPSSANAPPYQLRGFDSVYLTPGQSKTVSFSLTRYDLSIWNAGTQRWEIPTGTHGVTIGASSRDRRLTSSITV